jgi:hypothetical protein
VLLALGLIPAAPASASPVGADLSTGNDGGACFSDCYSLLTFTAGSGNDGYAGAAPNSQPSPGLVSVVVGNNAGTSAAAPVSGVLVSYSVRLQQNLSLSGRVRVMHDPGGTPQNSSAESVTMSGTGDTVHVPGDAVAHTFLTRLPITQGDLIGFEVHGTQGNSAGILRSVAAGARRWRLYAGAPDGTAGPSEANLDASVAAYQAPVSGVIEPDADADGFGDQTQDQCVGLVGPAQGCPALLTVVRSGPGTGSVTGSGINCPSTCSQGYSVASVVTLTASPGAGSTFAGWSGACSGTGACQVTMDRARTVVANFGVRLPNTAITKSSVDKRKRAAKFSFRGLGAGRITFECKLDHGHFRSCRSPKSYKHLKPGTHTFQVRAKNEAGADPSPARKSFKIPKPRHR